MFVVFLSCVLFPQGWIGWRTRWCWWKWNFVWKAVSKRALWDFLCGKCQIISISFSLFQLERRSNKEFPGGRGWLFLFS